MLPTLAASSTGARTNSTCVGLEFAGLWVDVVTCTQPVAPAVPAGGVAQAGRPGPEPHTSSTLAAPSLALLSAYVVGGGQPQFRQSPSAQSAATAKAAASAPFCSWRRSA